MQRSGVSFDLAEVPAPDEHHLQEAIKSNPQLIPSDDLGLDGDLLVVGRETTLASGAIDLLCLARSGDLVLIEFKTGPQNPDFRHALAQVIDYGSDLWQLTRDDLDRGVVQRYLSSTHCVPAYVGATNLDQAIGKTDWQLSDDERAALDDRLSEVLMTGDFIYVVAAQRFTPAMTRSLDYLNTTMRAGRFYLVEVVRLQGADLTAHAAQVFASPPKKTATSRSGPASQANEGDFLDRIDDDSYREAMRDIFSSCATLGLTLYWGSKGASIKIPTPDRSEPLSIGWAFLEGDQWFGARHLTLGVDRESLAHTPSVKPHVDAFIDHIKTVDGAKPVSSRLDGYTFEPNTVPSAKKPIIGAIESLVEALQTDANLGE